MRVQLRAGFPIDLLESMDIREKEYIIHSVLKEEKDKMLIDKLNMAEAMSMALVRMRAKGGARIYNDWRKEIEKKVFPEAKEHDAGKLFWGQFGKSKKLM